MINNTNMTTALARRNRVGVAQHLESKRLAPNRAELIAELAATSVQGIIVLGERNIEFSNARARDLNRVLKSVLDEGKPWMQFFKYQMKRGDFGEGQAAQDFFDELIKNFKKRKVMQVERIAGDGRIIRADRIPNSIGCMTLTLTDISDLKAREAELSELNRVAQTAE
ncbi:MAG: PAS-domain containing protein [Amylibacter sp.]